MSPRIARWIARALLPAPDAEFIVGDLEELHAARTARQGRRHADRRYWREALASVLARSLRRPGRGSAAMPSSAGPSGPSPRGPNLLADLHHAFRRLRREPRFTALAVVTLAVGIGASAAGFGMVDSLLFRPLPGVPDARDLAYLQLRAAENPENPGVGITLEDVDALRDRATLLDGLGTYSYTILHVSMNPGERPIAVSANTIYGDFFEVLGVRPAEGRMIRAAETDITADPAIAVISEDLRGRLFGSEPEVAGRTLILNGEPFLVVGVAGRGFRGTTRGAETDVWVPKAALVPLHSFPMEVLTSRNSVMHNDFVLRPRAGASAVDIEAQVAGILRGQAEAHPESAEYLGRLTPDVVAGIHVPPNWREGTYRSLRLVGGVVALVLLIACANVANLLLFRNVRRRGAIATRRALGASPAAVAREHLAESLILALAGAAAGLGVAWLLTLPFRGERIGRMPAFESLTIDGGMLAFAVGLSVLTALLFGAAPAALAGRFDLADALRDASGRETGRLAGLRWLMSAAQIAICLTLLVGGLLLTRTVRNLYAVETGFDIEGVSALFLDVREAEPESMHALAEELRAAVRAAPGVVDAAIDIYGPHASTMRGRIGQPDAPREELVTAHYWPVSANWTELFRVRMEAGRAFQTADADPGAPGRVILTAALARRLFGTTEVVGRTLQAGFASLDPVEVVGVTGDLYMATAPGTSHEAFFVPFGNMGMASPFVAIMTRTRELDARTLAGVREAAETVLPALPVPDPQPIAARVDQRHSERLIFSRLLGILSGLAVLLAAVGLYGVIAFQAAGRMREFGIRLALGAHWGRIAGLVLGDATRVVVAGTLAGLLGAWWLSGILESRLFGVTPLDPLSYGGAVLILAGVAAFASFTPARHAVRVDPVETLRRE